MCQQERVNFDVIIVFVCTITFFPARQGLAYTISAVCKINIYLVLDTDFLHCIAACPMWMRISRVKFPIYIDQAVGGLRLLITLPPLRSWFVSVFPSGPPLSPFPPTTCPPLSPFPPPLSSPLAVLTHSSPLPILTPPRPYPLLPSPHPHPLSSLPPPFSPSSPLSSPPVLTPSSPLPILTPSSPHPHPLSSPPLPRPHPLLRSLRRQSTCGRRSSPPSTSTVSAWCPTACCRRCRSSARGWSASATPSTCATP